MISSVSSFLSIFKSPYYVSKALIYWYLAYQKTFIDGMNLGDMKQSDSDGSNRALSISKLGMLWIVVKISLKLMNQIILWYLYYDFT